MKELVFKGLRGEFFKRRSEWFEELGKMHLAMWWVQPGHRPTFVEAKSQLELIQLRGEGPEAFSLRTIYDPE